MHWNVLSAQALEWPLVALEFEDGRRGVFDFAPYLRAPGLQRLNDPEFFDLVEVDHGTVSWPGGIDFAPERLHEGCARA